MAPAQRRERRKWQSLAAHSKDFRGWHGCKWAGTMRLLGACRAFAGLAAAPCYILRGSLPRSSMATTLTRLGPYSLGNKLGQGGMGVVYLGQDVDSGEIAAIKVLSPMLAAEEGFRSRFEAEIESLKKLRHPNIVRLFGYGEQDGYLYYSMELVEGTSLEEELRYGRRFTWREVTRLSVGVCKALKHAHDHGIIHRDIKPANLLLNPAGEVKLSDFGIARLFGNTRMTSEGGVLGTAEYMAPEQADGRSVTDRCDQYSLGGVMYALLTGRPPFKANSLVEMLQLQRFGEALPVRSLAPDTPEELERIIHQLLSKDPQKRFANTLLLSRALEAMELGLSRAASRDDFLVSAVDGSDARLTAADPLAATLVPAESIAPPAADDDGYEIAPEQTSGTAATLAAPTQRAMDAVSGAGTTRPSAAPGTLPSRFTKVEDVTEEAVPWYDDIWRTLATPQVLSTLAGLLGLVLLGAYFLQPPSADVLFGKIDHLMNSGQVDDLLEAEKPIDDFLHRYPQDPRHAEVTAYREQLTLARVERRFERQSRRLNSALGLSPMERVYSEAVQLAQSNPERALARFQSLIDTGETLPDDNETTRNVLELSRRQVARLSEQVQKNADADRQWGESQLAQATKLAGKDTTAARKIYQAIVEIYGDKPSMAEIVQKARAALDQPPRAQ